jgi:6-pyruvoyltetrahydropterin/6-carboxytetrahydropterin synthase
VFEISVKTHFSAAHHLVGYEGSCAAFHGHNWEVEVFVAGEELTGIGFLEDFRVLKKAIAGAVGEMDHADLNALPAFRDVNPTSERIARHLYERLSETLRNDRYRISRVCVCETPGTTATYRETP